MMNIQDLTLKYDKSRNFFTAVSMFLIVVCLICFYTDTYAVNSGDDFNSISLVSVSADTSKVYSTVDEMPQLIGGLESLYKNIKYPEKAMISGIQGKVFVQFILDQKGDVTSPKIIKDIGGGCGDAAIEALKKVKFTPGKLNGETVKVQYTLPVNFQIRD